jgi:hypothetical protein
MWYKTPPRRILRLNPREAAAMFPAQILDRFIERCPAAVMVRATLGRLLSPARLVQIFEDREQRQYTKQLLFSQVFAIMAAHLRTVDVRSSSAALNEYSRVVEAFREARSSNAPSPTSAA